MIEAQERSSLARLAPVLCAECGHPVCHYDPTVVGAKAGGMCTRASCSTDKKTGKPKRVYTYHTVARIVSVR